MRLRQNVSVVSGAFFVKPGRAGIAIFLLTFLLGSAAATKIVDAQEQKKTFAVIPVQLANPFFAEIERGAKEQSAKLGVNLIYTASATSDQAGQVQVFRDVMTRGVNGIAIAPVNGGVLVGVIAEARKRGIAVVMMNGDSPQSERQAYVGTDQLAASRKAGEAFRSLLPKGKYAVLTGNIAAVDMQQRLQGFHESIKEGDYTEVAGSPFPCNDDLKTAVQIVQDVLTRYPDLKGFYFAGGWPMFAPEAYVKALGARAADIQSKKLVIVSFDTLPEQLRLLKEGYASVLIGQRPYKIGIEVVNALNDLVAGKKVPAVVDTGTDVVDQNNVDQFLKK
ncbi:MAG: sugar-binding protein [Verrucomicrobia bacterium]|nr:sugar-binding protein [Verrucomicrobiota bacterium]